MTEGRALTPEERDKSVRIQWDPERSMRIGKLPYRSIQIGIGSKICPQYLSGIIEIQDITEAARKLKSLLDEGKDEEAKLLLPTEKVYPLSEGLRSSLKMDSLDEQFGGKVIEKPEDAETSLGLINSSVGGSISGL